MKTSTAIALLAIFIALSGTGYAALTLPKNSVTTRQVKDRSLLAKDFRRGQLPTGARGETGPEGPGGPKGDTGAPGPSLTFKRVDATGQAPPGAAQGTPTIIASCPAGMKVVGGGAAGYPYGTTYIARSTATPDDTGWMANVVNNGSSPAEVDVAAYCVTRP